MPKRISKKEAKKFILDGLKRRDQIIARLKAITDEERRLNKESALFCAPASSRFRVSDRLSLRADLKGFFGAG